MLVDDLPSLLSSEENKRLTATSPFLLVILQKGGGVGAVGTHEEIMRDHPDGVYAKYCKAQESSEAARLNVAVQMDDI